MPAPSQPWRRALATNAVTDSFANKIPVTAQPSNVGVFNIFDPSLGITIGNNAPQYIQIQPFGANANNEAFDMRLWGWSKIHNSGGTDHGVWVPQLLLDLTVTLGDIAATLLGTDHFLADTIAVNEGDADVAVISTADDTAAHILVHFRACQLIEFAFDIDTAASANALWRPVDHL